MVHSSLRIATMENSDTVLQGDFQNHPSGADRHFSSLPSTTTDETPENKDIYVKIFGLSNGMSLVGPFFLGP